MPTRREFVQSLAAAALSPLVPNSGDDQNQAPMTAARQTPTQYRSKTPLLQLQQNFVDLRFGMFLHYNLATYQDREWGDPTDPPTVFNPTALDTDQWAAAAKSAGMTYGCLTTKHHDGLCIWPTKTNVASIDDTPHKIDVVKRFVDSFRAAGLRVTLYYSILDLRNDIRHFNITPEKIQLIKDQLTELLTNYGPVDALIIDGWDAPWSRITYEEIPFADIYAHIKSLQPDCLLIELNAGKYPANGLFYTDIKGFEQNAGQHVPPGISVPALSCVTLTDGWFWKQADEHGRLKPTKTVVEDWLVPLNKINCNLILNAPPNRQGRLSQNLVDRLAEIGRAWKHEGPTRPLPEHQVVTTQNLATGRPTLALGSPDTVGPDQANDGDFNSTWRFEDIDQGHIEVDLQSNQTVNLLTFTEPLGRWSDYQTTRIRSYQWEIFDGAAWKTVVQGTDPGPVQMHSIPPAQAQKIRLTLTKSTPNGPHITEIGAYNEPPRKP